MTEEEKKLTGIQVERAIEILEKYVQSKEKEIAEIKELIRKAKDELPLIDHGYFKIVKYTGCSRKIKVGQIYRGSIWDSRKWDRHGCKRGCIPRFRVAFTERNASWILSTEEEYQKQQAHEA